MKSFYLIFIMLAMFSIPFIAFDIYGGDNELVKNVNEVPQAESGSDMTPYISESRFVAVNIASLSYPEIEINLFPGVTVTAIREKVEKRSDTDYSWFGKLKDRIGQVNLVVDGDTVTGSVVVEGQMYRITPLKTRSHAIYKISQEYFPQD